MKSPCAIALLPPASGSATGKCAAETEAREIVRIFARETYRESRALLQRARDAVELATTLSAAAIAWAAPRPAPSAPMWRSPRSRS